MDITPIIQIVATIIGGVTVFVLGQIYLKFFLDPVDQLSLAIGNALDTLVFYSNIYTNPRRTDESQGFSSLRKEACDKLRQDGVLLLSRKSRVRLYQVSSFFKLLPKEENLVKAHQNLIGLSNSCFVSFPELDDRVNEWMEQTPVLLSTRNNKKNTK